MFRANRVHAEVEYWKDFGREVAVRYPESLRCTEGPAVRAVERRGDPSAVAQPSRTLHGEPIARFERELAAVGSLGLVIGDGAGGDTSYRTAHRQPQQLRP